MFFFLSATVLGLKPQTKYLHVVEISKPTLNRVEYNMSNWN